MRVGLNATCFNDRPSGANQRFRGIYGALIRQRPDIEFVVYEPAEQRIAAWFDGAPNVSVRRTPLPSVGRFARMRAGVGYWRGRLRADELDLFETFHLPLVRAPDCPTILTIHDLRPIMADAPLSTRFLARIVMRHALSRADRVITVSDAVRDEIRAFQPSMPVTTIYNGVDPDGFARPADDTIAATRARYGLVSDYVLAVGHLEARKNLTLLIDAIAHLRDRGVPQALVVVGNNGGERDALRSRIEAQRLTEWVTVIEGVDDGAMRALYAGSTMLAFPSRYEGFGIPILEAMATRKPMVLSDIPVFRELTQGQGVYFPVDDPAAAAAAIAFVATDPLERQRQIDYGLKRLPDFAFDILADHVAATYRTLMPGLHFTPV